MLQHNDSRNSRDQESTERSMPSIPQSAEDGRDAEMGRITGRIDLASKQLVFLQVRYVVGG
jgi:hypothetical protein